MTCIVGIEDKGKVWLGGDSAASDDESDVINTRVEPKVWVSGEFVFGYSDSFRFGALLRYSFKAPKVKLPIEKYFATQFVPELRRCFKEDIDLYPDGEGKYPNISILIGLRGKLYCLEEDYQVGRVRDGYLAIGSGEKVAMGALYATRDKKPRDRVLLALNAAERFTMGVRAPFSVVSV